jgi:Tfp pilus assembly protein PilO
MKLILEKLSDIFSGSLKLLVVVVSIIISIYNFILSSLDEKVEVLRKEVHSLRDSDTQVINSEISNLNQKIDSGFMDIKEQNKIILNHLLRRK